MQVVWTHIIHTCPTVTSPDSRRTPSKETGHERGEQRCSQKYSPLRNIQRKASKWMEAFLPREGSQLRAGTAPKPTR